MNKTRMPLGRKANGVERPLGFWVEVLPQVAVNGGMGAARQTIRRINKAREGVPTVSLRCADVV